MTGIRKKLAIAGLLALTVAALVSAFIDEQVPGLEALPALTKETLSGTADEKLLELVQLDLSRRAGRDWRRLTEAQRQLFIIGALEEGVTGPGGFLVLVLAEQTGGVTARPQLRELALAYRWLALPEAADATDAALVVGGSHPALLEAWAAYDLSDPNRGPPPRNPFIEADNRFRAAVAPSPGLRIAWIRAHVAEVLSP